MDKLNQVFEKMNAEDVLAIPQTRRDRLADCIVFASADSQRQLGAMAYEIIRDLKEDGVKDIHVEGSGTGWVIVDGGRYMIHLMDKESRALYALESLFRE